MKLLFENEGISTGMVEVFLVYLLNGNRPISKLLAPNPVPLEDVVRVYSGNANE